MNNIIPIAIAIVVGLSVIKFVKGVIKWVLIAVLAVVIVKALGII